MIKLIFVVILLILTSTDLRKYFIPNYVVLPGIVIGVYLTGYWFYALIMFVIGACMFNAERIEGGDVKVICMTGAFIGWKALPLLILSRIFVKMYREIKDVRTILPYMPFVLAASICFLW